MLTNFIKYLLLIVVCILYTDVLSAQSLNIFGYSQSMYQDYSVSSRDGEDKNRTNSFYQQQTNIFLTKRFDASFTSFINLEMENNFDVQAGFGNISLQEAWINYRFDRKLQVKLGKLIPEFAGFNTIRNRTPLIDFASRPLMYEKLYRELLPNSSSFYPENAFAQLSGRLELSYKLNMKFSSFVGNGDASLMTSTRGQTSSELTQSGSDTTSTIMVGGRLGFEYTDYSLGIFSLGVSSSWDETLFMPVEKDEFYPLLTTYIPTYQAPTVSDYKASRVRLAFDFLAEFDKLSIRAEYYKVYNHYTDEQMDLLKAYDMTLQSVFGFSSTKAEKNNTAWFVLASYKLNNEWYVSTSFNSYEVERSRRFDEPLKSVTAGLGYRKGPIVLKTEYRYTFVDNENYLPTTYDNILSSKTLFVTAGFIF